MYFSFVFTKYILLLYGNKAITIMKNYNVTGYQMVKNPNTWVMEKKGDLMTISVLCAKNSIQMIEGEVANKMNFDWFEAVTISN